MFACMQYDTCQGGPNRAPEVALISTVEFLLLVNFLLSPSWLRNRMYICVMYICVYVCMYLCMNVFKYVFKYVCMYVVTYVCIYV